tara:strand:+ start:376 stop:756 length:381 start_codon:yes stop_codon:yes gene_type:complete
MAKGRPKKAQGLGDTIEQITEATGIKKAVEMFTKATGLDCGCDDRKKKLNKLFSYNANINCLNEKDFNSLTKFLDVQQTTLTVKEQAEVSDIYFNVFNHRLQISTCGSCWKGKIEELRKVHNEYKK